MKKLLLILLFIGSINLQAQFSAEKLDEKFTPPSGSIFDGDESVTIGQSNSSFFRRHEINLQISSIIRSKFNLEYRYNPNDYLSLGLAGGYNFAPDYILLGFSQTEYIVNLDDYYSVSNTLFDGTYTGLGFNLNPSVRVGMDAYYFDYGFVQLDYRFDFYQYELPSSGSGNSVLINPMNTSALNLIYGVKFSYDLTNNLSLLNTFYYGVGGRFFNLFEVDRDDSGNSSVYRFTNEDDPKKARAVAFTLLIGYNVGFGFNTKSKKNRD